MRVFQKITQVFVTIAALGIVACGEGEQLPEGTTEIIGVIEEAPNQSLVAETTIQATETNSKRKQDQAAPSNEDLVPYANCQWSAWMDSSETCASASFWTTWLSFNGCDSYFEHATGTVELSGADSCGDLGGEHYRYARAYCCTWNY